MIYPRRQPRINHISTQTRVITNLGESILKGSNCALSCINCLHVTRVFSKGAVVRKGHLSRVLKGTMGALFGQSMIHHGAGPVGAAVTMWVINNDQSRLKQYVQI